MKKELSRREMLRLALASPVMALPYMGQTQLKTGLLDIKTLRDSPGKVVADVDPDQLRSLKLVREWRGSICNSRLTNAGTQSATVREVVLFEIDLGLSPETRLYGEGFQMLSQTGGTLGRSVDLGNYTDAKHYKMPIPEGARAFYGMVTLTPPGAASLLMAFTSCRRFVGQFYLRGSSIQIVVDTEDLKLKPGESWELERFTFRSGPDREQLLVELARLLNESHPPLRFKVPPTGWCSWYCFGPGVTAKQVLENLDYIAEHTPGLRYIQIDDGYQPAMGDWLDTGAAFGGDVQGVLKQIRERGFEPAIWVAPFIAEEKSRLFEKHPDWFVKDNEGNPLPSNRVTFGGWRRGPWYALDGTHPEAQKHLESVFRTMREQWGCTYFKLDANFWGAIHGGRFHDPAATRVEAYRRGMQAVLRGAGNGFILGCNHPIWPSLGLIHGSRSSNDIKRTWARVKTTAEQNLFRNWQNGRLWWNDPDAIVLTGDLSKDEFQFHASAIYATGGMILSGDDLTTISADQLAMLRKLQPPTGVAARFTDESLQIGTIQLPEQRIYCLFNWSDSERTLSIRLPRPCQITDFWSGKELGRYNGLFSRVLSPHSARLLVCR
jgi:alpha-galactosidase